MRRVQSTLTGNQLEDALAQDSSRPKATLLSSKMHNTRRQGAQPSHQPKEISFLGDSASRAYLTTLLGVTYQPSQSKPWGKIKSWYINCPMRELFL